MTVKKMDDERGLVFVHTGNGKGKTTAALGLALRALGHGRKIFMVQFMKGQNYGEALAAAQYLPGLTLYKCGRKSFIRKGHLSPADIELAQKGFAVAKDAVFSGKYDMVILDEINVAVDFQLISLVSVLDLIKNKPVSLYLGLTGRNAPLEIIELADLVTEMKEIKQPFSKGIPAQKGFEF